MLKRLVRHRIFVVFVTLLVIAGCVFAPLRHEYLYTGDGFNAYQTTTVTYGAPQGWMTLTKEVNQTKNTTLNTSSNRDIGNLEFDFMVYGLAIAILILIHGIRQMRMRHHDANLGN